MSLCNKYLLIGIYSIVLASGHCNATLSFSPIGYNIKVNESTWKAESGDSLQALITKWGNRAGYKVVWDVPFDYPIDASFEIKGDFSHATTELFNAFISSDRPMKVDIYKQQKLIHIGSL